MECMYEAAYTLVSWKNSSCLAHVFSYITYAPLQRAHLTVLGHGFDHCHLESSPLAQLGFILRSTELLRIDPQALALAVLVVAEPTSGSHLAHDALQHINARPTTEKRMTIAALVVQHVAAAYQNCNSGMSHEAPNNSNLQDSALAQSAQEQFLAHRPTHFGQPAFLNSKAMPNVGVSSCSRPSQVRII